jgi:hypothetical protein
MNEFDRPQFPEREGAQFQKAFESGLRAEARADTHAFRPHGENFILYRWDDAGDGTPPCWFEWISSPSLDGDGQVTLIERAQAAERAGWKVCIDGPDGRQVYPEIRAEKQQLLMQKRTA